jgi:beta-xylosidase
MKLSTSTPPFPHRKASRLRLFPVWLLVVLLTAACGADATAVPPTAPSGGAVATAQASVTPAAPSAATATLPVAATATPAPAVATVPPATATEVGAAPTMTTAATGGATFQNPVLQQDFPDPDILQVGDTYYAYATNSAGKNVQVARSTDLVQWTVLSDAMPALAPWVDIGNASVWAPGVVQIGSQFVMYYTARDSASGRQCIGVATATKPEGHYKDTNSQAMVCDVDQGGDIDAYPLADNGKLYLYWKNDGNCCGVPTHLYGQELSADGQQRVGPPVSLLETDQGWEGPLIEAPQMLPHAGKYYLFFSANGYAGANYAVGYAACQAALGPCTAAPEPENPILKSKMDGPPLVIGPGGETFAQVGDQTWIVYHAWNVVGGTRGDARYMWIDRLDWKSDKPVVEGPTTDPQPAPVIP